MLTSTEDKIINKGNVDAKHSNMNNSTNNFVFPKQSSETKKALDKAEKDITEAVKSFVKALDSTSQWLTKELLDIFDGLKKIWWIEETKLWEISFDLMYEKHSKEIPDKIREILKEMLDILVQYNYIKEKSKTLEEMLRACASLSSASEDCSMDIWWERTFIPWNLGERKTS